MMKKVNICFMMLCMIGLLSANIAEAKTKKKKKSDSSSDVPNEMDSVKRDIIMVYPFSMIGGSLMAGYEHLFDKKRSIRFNAAFGVSERSNYYTTNSLDVNNGFYGNDLRDLTQLYGEVQFKFVIYRNPREDFSVYMAPLVLYKSMDFTSDLNIQDPNTGFNTVIEKQMNASAFGVGYILGFQLFKSRGFFLDTYFGGGMMSSSGDYKYIKPGLGVDSYKKGTFGHIGLAVGIGL